MIAPASDTLTHVELIWFEKRIEQWIRFGHDVAEQILDRRLAGYGEPWCVARWEPTNPTNGRQDKSAAFGRAQVVGWVGLFGTSAIHACWHFCRKCQRYQRSERRRRHFPRRVQP
jgi:hypothetical protein